MVGRLKKAPYTPFTYRSGKTLLHRIPAGFKLICVIAIPAAAFSSFQGLVVSMLLILAAAVAAHITPWELLKGSGSLLVLVLCIVLIKTVQPGASFYIPAINVRGFFEGMITALRLLLTFVSAALFFAVTTIQEIRLSFTAVELALRRLFSRNRKKNIAFFSLGLCLMLGFIPRFFELWESSDTACKARSCKRSLHRLFILVPLVTERMMEAAADTAQALIARGVMNDK